MSQSDVKEIQRIAEIMAKLASDEGTFKEIVSAHQNEDAVTFQSILKRLDLLEYCELICHWICMKRCNIDCEFLCPRIELTQNIEDIEEMRRFALASQKLLTNEEEVAKLLELVEKKDVTAFQDLLRRYQLLPFCRQICIMVCHRRCKFVCGKLCPWPPLITHVGWIPTSQFTAAGFANGPNSQPPLPVGLATPSPNPASGVGDHPFGQSTNIRGIFNIANPAKYRIEYSTSSAGPWTPVITAIQDAFYFPPDPPKPNSPTVQNLYAYFNVHVYNRSPDAGGWYNVADMGRWSMNESYFTDWNSPSGTGTYYLRLTVKNVANQDIMSTPIQVHVDNDFPTIDLLDLSLKKEDGTVVELGCCGGVKKGEGLVRIRFQAWDENFSQYSLVAQGGCSGAIPIASRTYNGNTSDKGEPVIKEIIWDPWSGPNAVTETCCYLIVLSIWDRAVVNNQLAQSHGPVQKWVSLQIGG